MIYNLDNELESFRKFKLILYSLPNGKVNQTLDNDHWGAGRGLENGHRTTIRIKFNSLEIDEANVFKWKRFKELDMI